MDALSRLPIPSSRLNARGLQPRIPLTRDLTNLTNIVQAPRSLSPDLDSRKTEARANFRRSRSAIDIRSHLMSQQQFKKTTTTNNLQTKSNPMRRSRSACDLKLKTGSLLKKGPTTTSTSNLHMIKTNPMRRSRSACDLKLAGRSMLKRAAPTTTITSTIPAKLKKGNSSSSSINSNSSTSSRLLTRPKLALNKTATTTAVKTQVKKPNTVEAVKPKTVTKKFAPYDYKGRFNDLLEKHKIMKEKFDKCREDMGELETLPELYEETQNNLNKVNDELKFLKTDFECVQRELKCVQTKLTATSTDLIQTKSELEDKIKQEKLLFKEIETLKNENYDFKVKTDNLANQNDIMTKEMILIKDQLFQSNIDRKDLHNTVMDLRGNIRVFCRVRPFLSSEEDRQLCGWNYLDETSLEISNLDAAKNKIAKHDFSFDQVFHPNSRQNDIFEMVSPLIQSALDGYNVCIFAYGQTGSGKTFTMDGVPNNLGIIPRTVDLLFDSIKNYKRLGWEYEIKVTFLEIYNEILYDLLSDEQRDLEIRMVSAKDKTNVYVSNITESTVPDADTLKKLMSIARQNRITAATAGNERSSRSHAVTKIELIGSHSGKQEKCLGSINLVDLAGSESPKTSTRMDETKKINRSLSELTNVILALLTKQEHIPYRNSKLTHLLMPSLGGNSKTLMFINVAPFQDCFAESVKSLRFAASVNSCKMAKAKKNKFLNISTSSNTSTS